MLLIQQNFGTKGTVPETGGPDLYDPHRGRDYRGNGRASILAVRSGLDTGEGIHGLRSASFQ